MDFSVALLAGMVAGLALAAPLGAIGVLLLQEGVIRGLRRGLPGAAAVATVDILYCALAVTLGSFAAPIVSTWSPWPEIIGGLALVALGAHGLLKARRAKTDVDGPVPPAPSSRGRFLLFFGLTAINPATLVYFAALLPGLDSVATSPAARIAFIIGVGAASFAWQALLVALGAGLRRKTGPRFRTWTGIVGASAVVGLGLLLIIRALG